MMRSCLAATVAIVLMGLDSGNCRGQNLREALDDIDVGDRWQYNDWEAVKAAATASGKPIFALFR